MYAKTINILCAGNKVFATYRTSGGPNPTPLRTPLEVSLQNWRLHRTIARHFGEKDTLRFLNIICHDEVGLKSTYDSRSVIFFDIIENVEACIC